MKLTRSLAFAAIAAAVGFPAASYAADGTITFNGNITAQTCTISGNGGGPNFTVTLPTVSTSALSADGSTAGRTPFNIALTNCSPDSGTALTYFEPGATVDTATGRLLNATGSASNVEIGLLNQDYSSIQLGAAQTSQNSQSATISGGAATLDYFAQYVATGGAAGAGSVNTTTLYSIVYQ
ncbi:fimbrial protein [Paraburkholderia antibiotica]|uniref:Type 1 fimbrial protein n=1 Tax=Paraburkholderia antibiotica TaxID=2728839 RepID=A0A7X9ZV93_9BURK|nr:fimbrial protein [Paraburkholderia antibiotica]NML29904.1 type 1 fimbrial protein [Paraburkholderia antibiotica]